MKSIFSKLLLLVLIIAIITFFIEQSFPGVFITLRVVAFLILVYTIIRYFSKK